MGKQMDIFDYEYGVIRRVLDMLEAVKISNTTAYRDNVYWRMGFDAAERVIISELKRGDQDEST